MDLVVYLADGDYHHPDIDRMGTWSVDWHTPSSILVADLLALISRFDEPRPCVASSSLPPKGLAFLKALMNYHDPSAGLAQA